MFDFHGLGGSIIPSCRTFWRWAFFISDTMGRRRLCFVRIRGLTSNSIFIYSFHSVRNTIFAEELLVLRCIRNP